MAQVGAFTFVLHSHLPYARLAGRWPHGEEWIHEAILETYVPLLQMLYGLRDDGVPFRLTLGITPVLAEQLADADVQEHFVQYLDDKIAAALRDAEIFRDGDMLNPVLAALAQRYHDGYSAVREAFLYRFERDLIGAFRRLQDDGFIQIITSAATHGYLPLLSRDSSLRAQLTAGLASYERHFGRKAQGIWLPECAYRPAYYDEAGHKRAGLEHFLAEYHLRFFFSETHTITGGTPVGVAAGDIIGPYGQIKRRYVVPAASEWVLPQRPASPYKPYFVRETNDASGTEGHSGVVVIGRNSETGGQVWSAELGYPGDFDYREFHKKAGTSGLQYWRVTGVKVELDKKDVYHPDWAANKVEQHAEHFAHLVRDLLRAHHRSTGEFGLIAATYDTELFGHWWHEGVDWLGKVLRHLADDASVELVTAGEFLDDYPASETLHLPEGSWGANGTHFTWDNGETHWMWAPIHEAEARMEALVVRFPAPSAAATATLNQAAREVLLAQSSDWPFLVTTGQAREYAIQRFSQHLERFHKLAAALEAGQDAGELTAEFWEQDKIFPDIDYHWFAPT